MRNFTPYKVINLLEKFTLITNKFARNLKHLQETSLDSTLYLLEYFKWEFGIST